MSALFWPVINSEYKVFVFLGEGKNEIVLSDEDGDDEVLLSIIYEKEIQDRFIYSF